MKVLSVSDAFVFVCVAGTLSACAMGEEPVELGFERGQVEQVAHIYYNLASGERVVTLGVGADGDLAGADTGSSDSIWSSLVADQCGAGGPSSPVFFGLDNPGSTSLSTGSTLSDYGDIAADTVVDCVRINWVTEHVSSDDDSDGIADGIEGLGGTWTWWDLDNGSSANQSYRTPLVSITLGDLPGHLSGSPGTYTKYSMDIDLADSSMEIGRAHV